jgi:hypothetical protein
MGPALMLRSPASRARSAHRVRVGFPAPEEERLMPPHGH